MFRKSFGQSLIFARYFPITAIVFQLLGGQGKPFNFHNFLVWNDRRLVESTVCVGVHNNPLMESPGNPKMSSLPFLILFRSTNKTMYRANIVACMFLTCFFC